MRGDGRRRGRSPRRSARRRRPRHKRIAADGEQQRPEDEWVRTWRATGPRQAWSGQSLWSRRRRAGRRAPACGGHSCMSPKPTVRRPGTNCVVSSSVDMAIGHAAARRDQALRARRQAARTPRGRWRWRRRRWRGRGSSAPAARRFRRARSSIASSTARTWVATSKAAVSIICLRMTVLPLTRVAPRRAMDQQCR